MTDTGIALVGFMGAGKTTVGRELADRLGFRFVDLDAEIERHHGPIPEIFAERGEATFRALELRTLESIDSARTVLATGGGTTVSPRARGILESRFHTVFLDVRLEDAAGRVGSGEGRPVWTDAEARFEARAPVYRSARTRVDATRTPTAIVDAIVANLGTRQERVDLGGRSYDITITDTFDGFWNAVGDDVRIVTDDTVGPLWTRALLADRTAPVLTMKAGESHKTLATWQRVVTGLLESRARRGTTIVALGGGVVGDLAGFAAATVNRGLPFFQVPTTTLAMVDSSVGGKTAVNHPQGKNLVGAFHQPRGVWMNLATLSTLDPRERRAGLAEVLKTGLVLDPVLLDVVEAMAPELAAGDPGVTAHVVALSVRAKARVVAEDEREAGRRMILNAGHTVGHGVERAAGYGRVLHGEAVAIGLVAETRWAERRGHCEAGIADRIERIAGALGLPTRVPPDLDSETIRDAMTVDKKASRDILYLPVPTTVGTCIRVPMPLDAVGSLLSETG